MSEDIFDPTTSCTNDRDGSFGELVGRCIIRGEEIASSEMVEVLDQEWVKVLAVNFVIDQELDRFRRIIVVETTDSGRDESVLHSCRVLDS